MADLNHRFFVQNYYRDEDSLFDPAWLHRPRGFQDLRDMCQQSLDALVRTHKPSRLQSWSCIKYTEPYTFDLPELRLELSINPLRVTATTNTLPRKWMDPLRVDLRSRLSEHVQFISFIHAPSERLWYFAVCILQLLELANPVSEQWHCQRLLKQQSLKIPPSFRGWDSKSHSMLDNALSDGRGVDVKSIAESAYDILSLSNEEICNLVPSGFRILHLENILRQDLKEAFYKAKEHLRKTLQECTDDLQKYVPPQHRSRLHDSQSRRNNYIEHLTRPELAFHGTVKRYVSSIVRNGFVKPGQKIGHTDTKLTTRCGSTHGRGIYTSPDARFALAYTDQGFSVKEEEIPHLRLLVCAVLRGRPATCTGTENWRGYQEPKMGYDSHAASSGFEWVVFDAARVLPCYVLHLDWGVEAAKYLIEDLPSPSGYAARRQKIRDPEAEEEELICPGDKIREKQRKQAAAAKWFPYGYGPAKGGRFVIEEIGEVDDDEENYGEYQGAVENGSSEEERSALKEALSKTGYNAAEANRVVDEFDRGHLRREERHKMLWHFQQAGPSLKLEGSGRSWFDEYFYDRTMPGKQA